MSEKTLKTQLYLVGQIYGKICREYPELDTPERLEKICVVPLRETLKTQMAAIQMHPTTHEINDYIMYRICELDEDMIDYCDVPVALKGCIVNGYESSKADFNAKAIIDKSGLTQQQIADELGVSRNIVGRWYRGEATPKSEKQFELEKLCWEAMK